MLDTHHIFFFLPSSPYQNSKDMLSTWHGVALLISRESVESDENTGRRTNQVCQGLICVCFVLFFVHVASFANSKLYSPP